MKYNQEANIISQMWEHKNGKKILIAAGAVLAIYSGSFLLKGAAKVIVNFKTLRDAIKQ